MPRQVDVSLELTTSRQAAVTRNPWPVDIERTDSTVAAIAQRPRVKLGEPENLVEVHGAACGVMTASCRCKRLPPSRIIPSRRGVHVIRRQSSAVRHSRRKRHLRIQRLVAALANSLPLSGIRMQNLRRSASSQSSRAWFPPSKPRRAKALVSPLDVCRSAIVFALDEYAGFRLHPRPQMRALYEFCQSVCPLLLPVPVLPRDITRVRKCCQMSRRGSTPARPNQCSTLRTNYLDERQWRCRPERERATVGTRDADRATRSAGVPCAAAASSSRSVSNRRREAQAGDWQSTTSSPSSLTFAATRPTAWPSSAAHGREGRSQLAHVARAPDDVL